jgi:hypothetical protein
MGSLPAQVVCVKKTPLLLLLLVVGVAPRTAHAASINFQSLGKAEVVTVAGVRNVSAWAGELTWTWLDGKPAGSENTFYSYCVDLLNNETAVQNVSVISSAATDGAEKAAWLFNTYAPIVHAGSGSMAAGLQLAIWEVLYDDGLSLTGGDKFWVVTTGTYATSSNAIAAGTEYLTALAASGESYKMARATILDAQPGAGQDQIIRSVPEPGTLLLLGGALLGMALARGRSRA